MRRRIRRAHEETNWKTEEMMFEIPKKQKKKETNILNRTSDERKIMMSFAVVRWANVKTEKRI